MIVHSIEESIEYVKKNLKTNELFIIGGGEIYKKCLEMNVVDRMYITHIETAFDGYLFSRNKCKKLVNRNNHETRKG